MNPRLSGVITGLLLLVTLAVLTLATGSLRTLAVSRWSWFLAAGLLHGVQFLIFSFCWAFFLSRTDAHPAVGGAVRVSLAALAGLLTPMNLGTDLLRSWLGRKHLGLGVAATGAASVLTRECKLHVMLLLAVSVTLAARTLTAVVARSLAFALAGLLAMATVFLLFRSRFAARLAAQLGSASLVDAVRTLASRVSYKARLALSVLLALGFAADYASLRSCFGAVNLEPPLGVAFVSYGILFFLSRIPFVPLGVGVVETAGFGFLRIVGFAPHESGALLVMWGFLRVAVPYTIAAAANTSLLRAGPEFDTTLVYPGKHS